MTTLPTLPVLYINLDRCKERDVLTKCTLSQMGIADDDVIRVRAIDMDDVYDKRVGECDGMHYDIRPNSKGFMPRPKEIAIILSHIRALQTIPYTCDMAVIMEDDMSFQYIRDWNKYIYDIVTNAPPDWSIIKLHSSVPNVIEKNIAQYKNGTPYLKLNCTDDVQSAGCYIIKKDAAATLLSRYYNQTTDTYSFPYKDEYCICETVIFTLPNMYAYTEPSICARENNITCMRNRNVADVRSNMVIHAYWRSVLGAEFVAKLAQNCMTQCSEIIELNKDVIPVVKKKIGIRTMGVMQQRARGPVRVNL